VSPDLSGFIPFSPFKLFSRFASAAPRWQSPKNALQLRSRPETPPMRFIVTLQRDETGMIVAECPAIPGCVSQGKTEAEALANVSEAVHACIETRAANGMPVAITVREIEVPV
jgi:predicted RNase H-like HicB family nuclease